MQLLFSLHPPRSLGAHTHCSSHHRLHCVVVNTVGERSGRRFPLRNLTFTSCWIFFFPLYSVFTSGCSGAAALHCLLSGSTSLRRNAASAVLWLGLHAAAHRRARRLRTTRHDVSLLRNNRLPGGKEGKGRKGNKREGKGK